MRPSCGVSSCYRIVNTGADGRYYSFRWQKLRVTELNFERQGKETQLTNLTSKEREIRKRIEDILCPQNSTLNADSLSTKLTINRSLTNGVSGTKGSDGGPKKAKKKHN